MGFWLEGLPLNKRWLCGGQPQVWLSADVRKWTTCASCSCCRAHRHHHHHHHRQHHHWSLLDSWSHCCHFSLFLASLPFSSSWSTIDTLTQKWWKILVFTSIRKYLNSSWVAQLQLPPKQLNQCTAEVSLPNEFLVTEESYFQTKPLKARMCDRDGSIWTTWSLLGFSQRKTTTSCNGRFKSRCWQCQMKSYSAMLAVSPSSS